jgi:hypothetical protein
VVDPGVVTIVAGACASSVFFINACENSRVFFSIALSQRPSGSIRSPTPPPSPSFLSYFALAFMLLSLLLLCIYSFFSTVSRCLIAGHTSTQ